MECFPAREMRAVRAPSVVLVAATLVLSLGLVGLSACSSARQSVEGTQPVKPGPAELWAWNCARCHQIQPASRYSDDEWRVAMHHMRLQCYLTGDEQRAIEQLLRSGND